MDVLHILPYVPFTKSGGAVRDYNIIKYLSKAGVPSQVVCNLDADDIIEDISLLENELNIKIYATKAPDLSVLKKIRVVFFQPYVSTDL